MLSVGDLENTLGKYLNIDGTHLYKKRRKIDVKVWMRLFHKEKENNENGEDLWKKGPLTEATLLQCVKFRNRHFSRFFYV